MNICMIIHSKSGTTLKFGQLIAAKLKGKGLKVDLTKLTTDPPVNSGTVRFAPPFKITNLPDISKYDIILVGGPVWAFSASPVAYAAIKGLGNLAGKKFMPFVTMGFFHPALGGRQAIELMGKTAAVAGAEVLPGKAVQKMFGGLEGKMEKAAGGITEQLSVISKQ